MSDEIFNLSGIFYQFLLITLQKNVKARNVLNTFFWSEELTFLMWDDYPTGTVSCHYCCCITLLNNWTQGSSELFSYKPLTWLPSTDAVPSLLQNSSPPGKTDLDYRTLVLIHCHHSGDFIEPEHKYFQKSNTCNELRPYGLVNLKNWSDVLYFYIIEFSLFSRAMPFSPLKLLRRY